MEGSFEVMVPLNSQGGHGMGRPAQLLLFLDELARHCSANLCSVAKVVTLPCACSDEPGHDGRDQEQDCGPQKRRVAVGVVIEREKKKQDGGTE